MLPILTDIANITTEVAQQNIQIQNIIAFFQKWTPTIKRSYSTDTIGLRHPSKLT